MPTHAISENPTNVFTMSYPGIEPLGTIAIVARDHINVATTTSLLMVDYGWVPKGRSVNRLVVQGGILTMQRNECVQRMEGDWLLFIDDDMVFDPAAVGMLVKARDEGDFDILGGLCFRRAFPHQPTLYMREAEDGAYTFLEDWSTDIVEVDATGMAFCLIHKRVFEKIADSPMPPLDFRLKHTNPNFFVWNGKYGEDLAFCQSAKAAGCRVFVDTRIEIGHIGEKEFRHRDYWQAIATRSPEDEAKRRVENDALGFPTLTADVAKERLGWR